MRRPISTDARFGAVSQLLADHDLHTVCRSARCPNRHHCWNRGTATFLILGGVCTRNCRFCVVEHGRPAAPDPGEPDRVARAAAEMKLRHVVVTSVTRDDLPDGGAGLFAATIDALRRDLPAATIEVLTPDFGGSESALATVLAASPDIFNHNLETVRRLQAEIRPQASYDCSLSVLRFAATWKPGVRVKSGLMLGMGETDDEIRQAIGDLFKAGCRLLTLGQYLAPTRTHWPLKRYVEPVEFDRWADEARNIGFEKVAAGPLVRSSFEADRMAVGRLKVQSSKVKVR
jgi:lipoic acid synthetase